MTNIVEKMMPNENGELVLESTEWHDEEGRLHRDGGPALIYATGTEVWCQHGVVHRVGGPAQTYPLRNRTDYHWVEDGQLHRTDGPAIETVAKAGEATRASEWWYEGNIYDTYEEYAENLTDEERLFIELKYGKQE